MSKTKRMLKKRMKKKMKREGKVNVTFSFFKLRHFLYWSRFNLNALWNLHVMKFPVFFSHLEDFPRVIKSRPHLLPTDRRGTRKLAFAELWIRSQFEYANTKWEKQVVSFVRSLTWSVTYISTHPQLTAPYWHVYFKAHVKRKGIKGITMHKCRY